MEEPAGSSLLLSDNSSDCSSKSGFKMREGKITRNGFLNFLRCYRKSCCAKNVVEVACEGAKIWNRMSDREKAPYMKAACKAPRRPSGCRSKSRRRRHKSRRCGSSCGRKRKRSRSCRKRKRSCSKRRRRSCGLPKRKRRRSSCRRKRRPACRPVCRPKRKRSRCKRRKKTPACLCPPKRKKRSCRKIC